jgi:hypothetical protein
MSPGPFRCSNCREIPDESTYEKVLGIAKTHCPELVEEIEKHKRISDASVRPADSEPPWSLFLLLTSSLDILSVCSLVRLNIFELS